MSSEIYELKQGRRIGSLKTAADCALARDRALQHLLCQHDEKDENEVEGSERTSMKKMGSDR